MHPQLQEESDENYPVVLGLEKRISLPYNDPKEFDGTPHEASKYTARVMEIGAEILYAFSLVKVQKERTNLRNQ